MTTPVAGFATLGVPDALVDALTRAGITEPFDIQRATIPDAIAGRDVLGRAPTGSGKTLAFGIPMLADLDRAESRRPSALILSPTRELAEQIRRELTPLADAVDLKVLAVYGGVGIGPQASALRRGIDVLVACPGRLQDLIDRGAVSLDHVSRVVVDEADRMADMGFLPAVRTLLDLTSAKRQTVLFSATLDRDVQVLIDAYQRDPARHEVGLVEPDLSTVTHRFIATDKSQKLGLTADLVDDAGPTMVFCRTRHGVDRVARQLKRVGVKAGWIHGGRTQSQRDAALHSFTTGRVQALVATDVAARGIHVDGVACVIHFDPPADGKDYVHRSGRTARAGADGVVVSLVNTDQKKAVAKLQKDVGLPKIAAEPAPEISDREIVAWVDQRPPRGGSSKGRASKTNGSKTNGSKGNGSRGNGSKGNGYKGKTSNKRNSTKATSDNTPSQNTASGGHAPKNGSANGRSAKVGEGEGSSRPKKSSKHRTSNNAGGTNRTTTGGERGTASGSERSGEQREGNDRRRPGRKPRPTNRNGNTAGNGKKKSNKNRSKRSGRARAKDHKQSRQASNR
ncbi:MAG: DEAD/DEAH box helicase [Acidimicrobiales bacterium]